MNNSLIEARRASATLTTNENGKEILVRESMISYISGTCDALDEALSRIPAVLQQYELSEEYDTEQLQRAIVRDGYAAIVLAVRAHTIARLEQSGLFPKVRAQLAEQNVDALEPSLRDEVEAIVSEINGLNSALDIQLELAGLWFEDGKLRIPPKYRSEIPARYTLAVSSKDRKTVEQIREAATIIRNLQKAGVQTADEMRVPPAGGSPILAPGLISRMAQGSKYSDGELLGLLHGINLTH